MPKFLVYGLLMLLALALVPPALIARARTSKTQARRVHYIQDMDNQGKFRAQQENPLFADGRAMRPRVAGTVARGDFVESNHHEFGTVPGGWAQTLPAELPMSMGLLERGRERFEIYCALCHGMAGYGDGMINRRANLLMANPAIGNGTAWTPPKNMHEPEIRAQPIGQVYSTITNGIRNMPAYQAQIPLDDRWAIAAYVKALQRSQNAEPGDVPAGQIDRLPTLDLTTKEEGP